LNQWKEYVSYEEIVLDHPPSKRFGEKMPSNINEDLLDRAVIPCFKYYPLSVLQFYFLEKSHMWNVFTKQNLQIETDYEVVNEKIWQFFTTRYYRHHEIQRSV
jgi:hypothetical protein